MSSPWGTGRNEPRSPSFFLSKPCLLFLLDLLVHKYRQEGQGQLEPQSCAHIPNILMSLSLHFRQQNQQATEWPNFVKGKEMFAEAQD